MAGDNPAVAAQGNFTPQADGFEVQVQTGSEVYGSNLNDPSRVVYRFFKTVTGAGGQPVRVMIEVTRFSAFTAGTSVRYTYGSNLSVSGSGGYAGAGTVTVSTPAGATQPVTVVFDQFKPNFDLTLNGTLVGTATGALWRVADLPASTTGDATISGTAFGVTDSIVNGTNDGAKFLLADGRALEVLGNTANYYGPLGVYSCFSNCGISAAPRAGGGAIFAFNNTRLNLPNNGLADPAGRVLNGSISVGKSSGSLTATGTTAPALPAFTPTASAVQALNGALSLVFTRAAAGEGAGVVSLEVATEGGQVRSVLVKLGGAGGGQTYACAATATASLPACSGITLASDGLSVAFSSAVLGGSVAVGGVLPTQTLSGNLVAKGR